MRAHFSQRSRRSSIAAGFRDRSWGDAPRREAPQLAAMRGRVADVGQSQFSSDKRMRTRKRVQSTRSEVDARRTKRRRSRTRHVAVVEREEIPCCHHSKTRTRDTNRGRYKRRQRVDVQMLAVPVIRLILMTRRALCVSRVRMHAAAVMLVPFGGHRGGMGYSSGIEMRRRRGDRSKLNQPNRHHHG